MSSGNRHPILLTVLVLLAINAVVAGRGTTGGGWTAPLRHAAERVAAVLTLPAEPLYRALQPTAPDPAADASLGVAAAAVDVDRLAEAHAAALREVDRLRQANARLVQDLQALGPVRALLEEYGLSEREAVAAGVRGRVAGPPMRLQITAGERQRVRPGDPVVYRYNLVGIVAGRDPSMGPPPGPSTAEVLPLSQFAGSFGVRIVSPPLPAAASPGDPLDRATPARVRVGDDPGPSGAAFVASGLAAEADVRPGDWVRVADPVLLSDAAGFVLGEVVSVDPEPNHPTLLKAARIRPRVNPARLTRVTVLTRPAVEVAE